MGECSVTERQYCCLCWTDGNDDRQKQKDTLPSPQDDQGGGLDEPQGRGRCGGHRVLMVGRALAAAATGTAAAHGTAAAAATARRAAGVASGSGPAGWRGVRMGLAQATSIQLMALCLDGQHGGSRQTAQTRPAEPRWNRWKGQNPAVDLLEPPRACSVMFEPDATHWARSTHHPVQNDEEMGGRAISTGGVARVATLALTVPVHWPAWNPAAQPMKKGRLGGGKTETPHQCGTAVDRQPHRRATDKSEPTLVRGHLRVVDVRDTRATLSNRGRRRERETLPSSLPALQASNVPAW